MAGVPKDRITAAMVRKARIRWGLSQAEFAAKMGYTPSYVANAETGRQKITEQFVAKFFLVEAEYEPDALKNLRLMIDVDRRATVTAGIVYVIRAKGHHVYKIGISNDPKKRLRNLQAHSPVALEIVGLYQANDCQMIERLAYLSLRRYHLWGEWYQLSETKAANLLDILSGLAEIDDFDPIAEPIGNKHDSKLIRRH